MSDFKVYVNGVEWKGGYSLNYTVHPPEMRIDLMGEQPVRDIHYYTIGSGEPERVFIPAGDAVVNGVPYLIDEGGYATGSTMVRLDEPTYECAGPACDKKTDLDECLDNWIIVARNIELTKHFCSLMCLANWLAGELAKEEDHGSSHHQ